MKYDDASWHSDGNFPVSSPAEFGGTHIALFLKWCFLKGWASQMHLDERPEDVECVISGKMAATEFLFRNCDGKLTNEDLNDEGNRFASSYYGENGAYLADYERNFSDEMYVAPERAHDFTMFSSILERRFAGTTVVQAQVDKKPWWKFWS